MEAIGQVTERQKTFQRTSEISKRTKAPCHDETRAENIRKSFRTEIFWVPEEKSHTTVTSSDVVSSCRENSDKVHAFENTSAQEISGTPDGYETSDDHSSGTSMASFSGSVTERDQIEDVQKCELENRKPLDTFRESSETIAVLGQKGVTNDSKGNKGNCGRESTESSERSCVERDDCNLDTKICRKRSIPRCNSENTFINEMTNLKQNMNAADSTLSCQNTGNTLQTRDLSFASKENISSSDTPELCLKRENYPLTKSNHSKQIVVPVFHYTRDADSDDANETQQSKNAELNNSQSEDLISKKVASRSLHSVRFSDLEYEEILPRSNFKSAQHSKFLSASSCSDLPRKGDEDSHCTLKPGILNLPCNSLILPERTKGNLKRGSVDIYYEELSDLVTKEHSIKDITESRRQSLQDVVPELPTRFSTSRAGCSRRPSDFVQNLFWWRRPSDITDLKSTTKHSCEGQESSDWEEVCSVSAQKRYSENLFCKPKRYLTLRLNRLREMWNNREKTLWHIEKMQAKQHNKTDSTEDFEVQEDKEAIDSTFKHLVQKEKNEIIINTLREVVRKCTIMDPEQRPHSNEVYKKLKKLLV